MAKVKGHTKPSAHINTGQKEKTGKGCKVGLEKNEPEVEIQSCHYQHCNGHAENGMQQQGFAHDLFGGDSHSIKIANVFHQAPAMC